MIDLIKAFLLALVAVWVALAALSFLDVSNSTVDSIALFIFTGGTPYIHNLLASRKNAAALHGILKIEEFELPAWQVATYSVLLCSSLYVLNSGLTGFIEGFMGVKLDHAKWDALRRIFGIAFIWPLLFLLGFWVGKKLKNDPTFILLFTALSGQALLYLWDFMALGREGMLKPNGEVATSGEIAFGLFVQAFFYFAPMFAGGVFGREGKFASYMNYLFNKVEPDQQKIILELAYEEAANYKLARDKQVNKDASR